MNKIFDSDIDVSDEEFESALKYIGLRFFNYFDDEFKYFGIGKAEWNEEEIREKGWIFIQRVGDDRKAYMLFSVLKNVNIL